MRPYSNLSLLRLSIYAAGIIAAAEIIGPISSPAPVVAQQAGCTPAAALKGTPVSKAPQAVFKAAQKVASKGNVQLKVFDVGGDGVYEFAGSQKNGCLLEVDVFKSGKIQEIETQLPSLKQVPSVVSNLLKQEEPGLKVAFIEESIRPQASGKVDVFYEIESTRPNGTVIEATINQAGTVIETVVLEKLGD